MGDGGIITGAVAGLAATAIQGKQQKIAAQKQRDIMSDAAKKQDELIAEQKASDALRKKQEAASTQAAFIQSAANRQGVSGADLSGAVAASSIGTVNAPASGGKKLIGS